MFSVYICIIKAAKRCNLVLVSHVYCYIRLNVSKISEYCTDEKIYNYISFYVINGRKNHMLDEMRKACIHNFIVSFTRLAI